MDHMVKLDKLPADLKFPPEFSERIRYDAPRHQLVFHGFMRKVDYDRLSALHRDLAYLDALQELFAISTLQPAATRRGRWPWVCAGGVLLAGAWWLWRFVVPPSP